MIPTLSPKDGGGKHLSEVFQHSGACCYIMFCFVLFVCLFPRYKGITKWGYKVRTEQRSYFLPTEELTFWERETKKQ